jgi:hypothetical protein
VRQSKTVPADNPTLAAVAVSVNGGVFCDGPYVVGRLFECRVSWFCDGEFVALTDALVGVDRLVECVLDGYEAHSIAADRPDDRGWWYDFI